mmetsp:Transcript_27251/g.81716  ORF Transcript_27251/g.81716 Transcript_27251/m.81716 type:complete len:452 (+) Transcript_27251:227-1582(+)
MDAITIIDASGQPVPPEDVAALLDTRGWRIAPRDARPRRDRSLATTFFEDATAPYLLARVVEYACPEAYVDKPHGYSRIRGSWSGGILKVGCVNKAFLKAISYYETLDLSDLGPSKPHGFRATVPPWLATLGRRFQNVTTLYDGGYDNGQCGEDFDEYGGAQSTKAIVALAASFPRLKSLELGRFDDIQALCSAILEEQRAGRLRGLDSLRLSSRGWPLEADERQRVKLVLDNFLQHLHPPTSGFQIILSEWGLYNQIMVAGQEYSWVPSLYALIERGADIIGYPIIDEVLYDAYFPDPQINDMGYEHAGAFCQCVEKLLGLGANPNIRSTNNYPSLFPLERLLNYLVVARRRRISGSDPDYVARREEGLRQYLFPLCVRLLDLLLRHGAVRLPPGATRYCLIGPSDRDWILARPECTERVQQEVLARASANEPGIDHHGVHGVLEWSSPG